MKILNIITLSLLLYLSTTFNVQAQMYGSFPHESGLPPMILDRVLALAYIHKLDEQHVQKLLVPLQRAADQEFPVHIMLMKIEEGLSKKIAAERIVQTLDAMIIRFSRLDLILRNQPPHTRKHRRNDLSIMNGLVDMGITMEELEARLNAPGNKPGPFQADQVFRAMEVKVILSNAGLPAENVHNIVEKGLASGFFRLHGCRRLAFLVHAAAHADDTRPGIELARISKISMQVVTMEKTINEAARELGVEYFPGHRPRKILQRKVRHKKSG